MAGKASLLIKNQMLRFIRDLIVIMRNLLVWMVLIATRFLTAPKIHFTQIRNYSRESMYLITPIQPSHYSGGGKAVHDLIQLFSRHISLQLILLPELSKNIAVFFRKTAEALLSSIPALRSSSYFLFGSSLISSKFGPGKVVFIEFLEGAFFLVFSRRVENKTILRDHEVLSRRIRQSPNIGKEVLSRIKQRSSVLVCDELLRNIYGKVDKILTLTSEDADYIRNHFPKIAGKVANVPVVFGSDLLNAITKTYSAMTDHAIDPTHLLFVANLHHRPNMEALDWFLRQCTPHLGSGFTLHLCGIDKPLDGYDFSGYKIKVVRHGFIDDLEAELGWVRVGISPVVSGGGIRIKNLYLAATGRAIVTTPLGNEGIGFVDGEEALICHSAIDMANALERFVKEPSFLARIGSKAARKVKLQFDSSSVWEDYKAKIFE